MKDCLRLRRPVLLGSHVMQCRKVFTRSATPELEDRVQALQEELGALRRELSEVNERLDFAERLLARAEEARRVDKGG